MLETAKAVQTDCLCGAHTAVVRRALNTLLSADAPAVSCAFDRSQWRLPLFRDIFLQFYCNVLGRKDRLFVCSLCPFPDQPSDMPSHWQRRQVSFCFDSWRRKGFREQKTCLAINNAPDTGRASPFSYFRGGSGVESACNAGAQETQVQSLGQEDPLVEEMATHSSVLAGEIPWTEEPGGLQSMWAQRV